MNIGYRTLFPVLALAASLGWQAPTFADPPSSPRSNPAGGHDQARREYRGAREDGYHNPPDQRYQQPTGGHEREARPPSYAHNADHWDHGDHGNQGDHGDRWDHGEHGDHWEHGDQRYPRYPVYFPRPIYPVHPIYPVYPVYPRFPAYYVYRGYPRYYPRYYGYYGGNVYHGYYGDPWGHDYGVVSAGRCNTDAVLGVAGAVTGAIIGNRTSAPQNRGIATVFGAIAGGIIGAAVGTSIDEGDRACFGQTLELAPIGRPVVWTNPNSHVEWQVMPVQDVSAECREFDVRRTYDGRYGSERLTACRRAPGEWAFQS